MPKMKRSEKRIEYQQENATVPSSAKSRIWRNIILIALLILGFLLWKFKGSFIAATVNGQPISRFELNGQLEKKFGSQILDNIINERLILAATRQKGIFIQTQEIDNRTKQIEGRLQGEMKLDEALKAQGLTKEDFRKQIEIQLSIEKLFDKESTVSAKEIDEYLAQNEERYKSATDQASVRREVEGILRQQKMTDLFEEWFAQVRKNAKIRKFF